MKTEIGSWRAGGSNTGTGTVKQDTIESQTEEVKHLAIELTELIGNFLKPPETKSADAIPTPQLPALDQISDNLSFTLTKLKTAIEIFHTITQRIR